MQLEATLHRIYGKFLRAQNQTRNLPMAHRVTLMLAIIE